MIAVPTENRNFLKEFLGKTHNDLLSGSTFTVIALPWKLATDRYNSLTTHLSRQRSKLPTWFGPDSSLASSGDTALAISFDRIAYVRAIHILQIPEWLRDFMAQKNRPYCVWSDQGNGTNHSSESETRLLRAFLAKMPEAKDVGHSTVCVPIYWLALHPDLVKSSVRVVFVHIGAVETLFCVSSLAKVKPLAYVQFITYGTCPTVEPRRWGIHEILLLGAPLSFMPLCGLIRDA